MIKAYILYWKNMVNFKDRARRAHYWWPAVIQSVISLIVSFMLVPQVRFDEYGELASITGSGKTIMVIFLIWLLASIVPSISVTVRRLHDLGKSGWWYFLQWVPCVGGIVMLIFMCMQGTSGSNKYGEDPLRNV